jgi:antitoxin ParD1/3/4
VPCGQGHLVDPSHRFIKAGVTSGRFSDASEVVREGLRLLEHREQENKAKLRWLRIAAKNGFDAIERGDSTRLRSKKEIKDFLQEIREDVSTEVGVTRKRA